MSDLKILAELIRERNSTEERISEIISRPASIGHLGEFIAGKIFDIELAKSANQKSLDGWFTTGLLAGKSVNIKWYAKREGILDMCTSDGPDYYLVLCGPPPDRMNLNRSRPWLIDTIFLFEHQHLVANLTSKIGIASSVKREIWNQHEVYPQCNNPLLNLTREQISSIELFKRK